MNARQRVVLEVLKSQCHDWALNEPKCRVASINAYATAPPELLHGPPIDPFTRADRWVISTDDGIETTTSTPYREIKLFFGSVNAHDAFCQIVGDLNGMFRDLPGDHHATNWFDYLFDFRGFGCECPLPMTWRGSVVTFTVAGEPRPPNIFDLLHHSPFLASEMAIGTLLVPEYELDESRPAVRLESKPRTKPSNEAFAAWSLVHLGPMSQKKAAAELTQQYGRRVHQGSICRQVNR